MGIKNKPAALKSIPKTTAELKPAPYNPRSISEEASRALAFSMDEFGDLSGFVFNLRTGHLVAGHQRKERIESSAAIINFTEAADDIGTVGVAHIKAGEKLWPIRWSVAPRPC